MPPISVSQLKVPKSLSPFVNVIMEKPDRIQRLAKLCASMHNKLDIKELGPFALAIRKLAPNDAFVARKTAKVLSRAFAGVHFACLNDHNRNAAYDAALRNTVTPESIVLDIGAGSGVLSLMAARAGARHVYAVEIEPMVAEAAREIIRLNGYEDKITVIEKDILSVKLNEDLPELCNMVIQDIIYADPLNHDIQEYLTYAKENLLTEQCVFFPSAVELRAALSDADKYIRQLDYSNISGFDFSKIITFEPVAASYSQENVPEKLLTDYFTMWKFDLTRPEDISEFKHNFDVQTQRSGNIHHVFRWVRIIFPDGSSHEDGFESRMTCRDLSAYKVLEPIPVTKGQDVHVRIEAIGRGIYTSCSI